MKSNTRDLFKRVAGTLAATLIGLSALGSAQASATEMPHLARHGQAQRLMVDGQPYLILGGELGNSSASDPVYLNSLWPKLDAIGLNTLLAPIEWDQIEPVEGQFDFRVTDALLDQARAHHVRLVVLWFGAWKNSMSTYAPAWVKHDPARFSKVQTAAGITQDILSPFDADTLAADTRAFVALMTHLKAVDPQHTVIMVQVENEIGMLPEARDHSPLAEKAFAAQKDTDEVFQARAFARFVNAEVKAGKAVYPLPMYVNAALNKAGKLPGQYPAGGPLPHLFDAWTSEAPALDFLAPDIYWPDFVAWTRLFAAQNPLFIPEGNHAGMPEASGNAFFAIGEYGGQKGMLGFSPFAIESLKSDDPLIPAYALLRDLSPVILAHQGDGTMRGIKAAVGPDGVTDETPQSFDLGGYRFTATVIDPWTPRAAQNTAAHGALIIQTGPDEFWVAGSGVTLTFADPKGAPKGAQVGIEQIVEGTVRDGQFIEGRWLNGDESHQGRHLRLPPDHFGLQRLKLYRYP